MFRILKIIPALYLLTFSCFGQGVDYLVIDSIELEGNKKTKDRIILRELTFSEGDTIDKRAMLGEMARSRENLQNTLLFNFVYIVFYPEGERARVNVEVVERWYIWPAPIFEHAERNLPAWLKDPEFEKLNYGLQLNWNNFRGRREILQLKTRFGYKEQYALGYSKPNLDRDQKHGIKFIINSFRQHEMIYKTVDDMPVYLGNEEKYLSRSFAPSMIYTYRPEFYSTHSFTLGYVRNYFADDSLRMEFHGFAEDRPLNFFTAAYTFGFDNRDYMIYPLSGYSLRLDFVRRGLGFVPSFDFGKFTFYLKATMQDEIIHRLYRQNALKLRLTGDEELPYIFRQALGYDTNIRGFEYYLVNGNSYIASVNNLIFNILPRKTVNLPLIPWEQFNKLHFSLFTKLFLDFAYVRGIYYNIHGNDLPNQFLWSTGAGFDLLSYYDQVYRLELTVNSLKEVGVYLHLETPFRRW